MTELVLLWVTVEVLLLVALDDPVVDDAVLPDVFDAPEPVSALVWDVELPTTLPPLLELADWSVLTWADWSTLLDAPPGSPLTFSVDASTSGAVFETVDEFV